MSLFEVSYLKWVKACQDRGKNWFLFFFFFFWEILKRYKCDPQEEKDGVMMDCPDDVVQQASALYVPQDYRKHDLLSTFII